VFEYCSFWNIKNLAVYFCWICIGGIGVFGVLVAWPKILRLLGYFFPSISWPPLATLFLINNLHHIFHITTLALILHLRTPQSPLTTYTSSDPNSPTPHSQSCPPTPTHSNTSPSPAHSESPNTYAPPPTPTPSCLSILPTAHSPCSN
jgi:hypothetical protein